jgi:hypothetical protein
MIFMKIGLVRTTIIEWIDGWCGSRESQWVDNWDDERAKLMVEENYSGNNIFFYRGWSMKDEG